MENVSEVETWRVTWFPPGTDRMRTAFQKEEKARKFATQEGVAEWNPILEHLTTRTVVSEIVL